MEVLMDVRDAAAFFRVSPKLIHRWIREEGLPHSRTSARGKYQIAQSEAFEWWKERRKRLLCEGLRISSDALEFTREIVEAARKRRAAA